MQQNKTKPSSQFTQRCHYSTLLSDYTSVY